MADLHVTFITGNPQKAEYVSRYLGFDVAHQKVELDEIQSLDLREIVHHKLQQAYAEVGAPVLVEDVSLEFDALGRLPGPFIKWFVDEMDMQDIANMVPANNRTARARCVFGFYDGEEEQFFEGVLEGSVATTPAGDGGYGYDKIFIPEGYSVTRAQMNEADDKATYLKTKPFEQVHDFLNEYSART